MTVGEKIYTLRTRAGFSQEAFADAVGVSRQSVSKWETSVVMPDTEYVIKICKLLHISTDVLLIDDELSEVQLQALKLNNESEQEEQPPEEVKERVIQSYRESVRDRRLKILTLVGFVFSFIFGFVGIILCSLVIDAEEDLPRVNYMSIWGLSISCVKFYATATYITIFLLIRGLIGGII